MSAQDANATTPVRAEPATGARMDPWLRMRLAPVRAARRPVSGAATVRHALRVIARARPDPAVLPLELRPVRALLDRERARLRQRLADGEPVAEVARAEARLLDGTIAGLCHLWRLLDRTPAGVAPPLAVIAVGDYARRRLPRGASAGLLFLVAADPVRRGQGLAAAQFITRELGRLGWQACGAKRTVRGCLAERHLDPAIAADLADARLVWGCRGLLADLRAGLAQTMSCAMPGTPQPSARPVLAA